MTNLSAKDDGAVARAAGLGALCIAAMRGLVRRQRPGWGYAVIGTLLLVFVAVPLIPIQPDLAGPLTGPGIVNLIALALARRRLEAG